ncbi:hypothetical protein [Kitasatospora sp. NBC_01266]|uniref:hypothetical protein n=1 Tax=Kitasatospora sp. NBC_01266 TaxID=2903572 RepID=UPI002E31B62F|nr:hypothetical protein [Kitasatospora sp. NBC_01266]
MSARARRRAAAVSLTIAVTTGTALLLTSCGPSTTPTAASNSTSPKAISSPTATPSPSAPASTAASAAASGAPSAAPTAPSAAATGSPTRSAAPLPSRPAPAAPSSAPKPLNGTFHNGLTISNGTRYVVMNGTTVDFGTAVRDLVWSPDGRKAAFVDGAGDLAVANPDGSGRVTVAKRPAGQTWSHPAWQVSAASPQGYYPAKDNLFFAAVTNGVSRLETVPATAVDGTPQQLSLAGYAGENTQPNPQTGNLWPAGGGTYGSSVYANSGTGEVFIRDESLRQQGGSVTTGSEPALSPDGDEIVFVRSVDGHDHLFESADRGADAKDLTPHATTDYTEPAWSPSGTTIAARTASGIVTLPANGSAAPTLVSGYQGLPAYRHS